MKFNVNGDIRELVAREYRPDTEFENMPDITETLLEDHLKTLHRDFLRRHYKADADEFAEMEHIVRMNNENVRMHAGLNAEQQSAYDDWDMTRCVNTPEVMTQKEHDFLRSLTNEEE